MVQVLLDPASPSTRSSFVMVMFNKLLLFAFLATASLRLLALIRIRLLASFTLLALALISRLIVVVVVLDRGLLIKKQENRNEYGEQAFMGWAMTSPYEWMQVSANDHTHAIRIHNRDNRVVRFFFASDDPYSDDCLPWTFLAWFAFLKLLCNFLPDGKL